MSMRIKGANCENIGVTDWEAKQWFCCTTAYLWNINEIIMNDQKAAKNSWS